MEVAVFNIEEFDLKLDTEIIGRNFIYIDEVESTNSMLLNSNEYKEHGTVLFAELQTKGRGRLNRDWRSTRELNLTFSILLKENIKNLNLVNLGTAVAIAHSINNLYQLDVTLKWPNDVLINDKKTAGTLIESSSRSNKIEKVVVGIGVNVNQTAFNGDYRIKPTSIKRECKETVSRERLLSELLNNFEEMLIDLESSKEKVLDDWKSRSKHLGEKIKIEDGDQTKFGVFYDIDEDGYLLLKNNDKIERITFGDVSLTPNQRNL